MEKKVRGETEKSHNNTRAATVMHTKVASSLANQKVVVELNGEMYAYILFGVVCLVLLSSSRVSSLIAVCFDFRILYTRHQTTMFVT